MQNQEIYDAALRILAEDPRAAENADYAERAPYLLAAFCSEASEVDVRIRAAKQQTAADPFSAVLLPLSSEFPLLPCFCTPAALYVAAMLILESDEDRSDKLYAQYSDVMSRLCDSIPASVHAITDQYF